MSGSKKLLERNRVVCPPCFTPIWRAAANGRDSGGPEMRTELDALYAKLYGLSFDELRYILDPGDAYGPAFPGEMFLVLKTKEIKKFEEYRTRRLVLEAWEKMGHDKV